jgi:hypothetical protein
MGSFSDTPALIAGGDVYPYRFIRIDTTGPTATVDDNTGVQVSAASDNVVGVSDGSTNGPTSGKHAADGDPITLQGGDVVLVECGGAVSRGGRVQADTDGKAVSAVATAGPAFRYQGYVALEAGASGQIIRVYRNGGMVYFPTTL